MLLKPLGKDEVIESLFWAQVGGQAVCDRYLAWAITSTLLLIADVCHCAGSSTTPTRRRGRTTWAPTVSPRKKKKSR